MASIATLERLAKYDDPKEGLFKELGDISAIEAFANRLLVAIYIGPEYDKRTKLFRAPGALKEDIYQGTVGLIVKKGPTAFVDDEKHVFNDCKAEIGDWVMFRPGDGKRIQFNGVDCRWLEDLDIDGKIGDPEIITYRSS